MESSPLLVSLENETNDINADSEIKRQWFGHRYLRSINKKRHGPVALLLVIICAIILVGQSWYLGYPSHCAGRLFPWWCKSTASTTTHDSSINILKSKLVSSSYSAARHHHQSSTKVKTILFWNAFNSYMGDKILTRGRCPVNQCLFTPDVTLLNQSDVVIFSIETTPDFIVNRLPHQRFVFFVMESSSTTKDLPILYDNRTRYNYFNWTMSYRRDSDVVLRDFLGGLVSKNYSHHYPPRTLSHIAGRPFSFNQEPKLSSVETMESTTSRRPTAKNFNVIIDDDIIIPSWIKGKNKLVAWYVSHCDTIIQREEYARQLGQYVPVDKFGLCTKRSPCPVENNNKKCKDNDVLRQDYKFYLAFENTWCPDYVTEKFYRAFLYDVVPIVLGGSDYERFAPPHSYINALDFETPKDLADYLLLLNSSDSLYARYFDWKKDYEAALPALDGWCDLCRMAHDDSLPLKVYSDIKQWWMDDGQCETDRTKYF